MNNLKKIGLSALAGSLVAMSAHAADVSISGGASVAITSGDQTGKSTYYQNDSISFSVSGETDGGLSITTSLELDGDASGGQGGDFDSQSLTIGHDTFGTVIFSGHGGSTVMGGWDDMVPNAYEESWAVTTGNLLINGAGTGNKLWRYNSPELLDGLTAHFAYSSQNTTANANSYTDMGVMYKPSMLEGLTLGYGVGEVDEVPAANGDQVTGIDESTMFVTYATGPVTIGYQTSEADGSTSTQDDDSTSVGISYAVTDDLSVSYGEHSLDLGSSTSDQESEGMSVSYTMGGTSIKATMNETTSVAGVSGTDRESYEIALVFAF
jgi:outer membrane protein OmpU